MKPIPLLGLLLIGFLLLTAERCGGGSDSYVMPDSFYRTWVHSHEEDFDGKMVYRRADYDFPPSRGRERFDVKRDGGLLYYGLAPNDGAAQPIEGKWYTVQERAIEISLPNNREKEFAAELVEISSERLVIRKLPGKF